MYNPKICSIELFRRCCLRCRMCHMWRVDDAGVRLDAALLQRLGEELEAVLSSDKEVVFSGGEPLLAEDIFDTVGSYSRRGLKVGMASNGVLLDDDMARRLSDAGLRTIQLSFDSCNQETHDFLRGVRGAHEKVLRGARCLQPYKGKLSVCAQTVISGKNIREIVDTVQFVADDKRFDWISFMAVTTPFFSSAQEGWQNTEEFSFLWPAEESIDPVIDELIRMKKCGYPIANPVGQFELFRNYFHHPEKRKAGSQCLLGEYVLSVDPAGDVRVCCFMPPIGNIRRQSLVSLLADASVERSRHQMRGCQKVCNTLVNCFFKENE